MAKHGVVWCGMVKHIAKCGVTKRMAKCGEAYGDAWRGEAYCVAKRIVWRSVWRGERMAW